jgi:predicted small metal-binding protein
VFSRRFFSAKGEKMEKFACKDLGIDCNFTATGATKEEVVQKAMAHGGVAHADLMKSMTKEQSAAFAKQLDAAIKTV